MISPRDVVVFTARRIVVCSLAILSVDPQPSLL